jgi:hypothetical protein
MIWCFGSGDPVRRKENLDEEIIPEAMDGFI